MSLKINSNISFLAIHRHFGTIERSRDRALIHLTSGERIQEAADDPSGIGISSRMRSQVVSLEQAMRNTAEAVNMIQTAAGAASIIDEKLARLRQIAVEASNGTLVDSDRGMLDTEFQALLSEIDRIVGATQFNGFSLIDGTYSQDGIKLHVGIRNAELDDFYFIPFPDLTTSGLSIQGLDVVSIDRAQEVLSAIDSAKQIAVASQTSMGSSIDRLQNTLFNLQFSMEGISRAESDHRDADIGVEMSEFVRAQMLTQTSVAMMSQANLSPTMVASLVGM